jgi:soluble lytic murein transglycosylase-like protein
MIRLLFLFTVACSWETSGDTSSVAPITEDVLPLVTQQYNAQVKSHAHWAERCMNDWELFEEASELSGYPPALIAGFAMHESGGCKMSARDRAGGRGFMQITSRPSANYRARAAKMASVPVSELDYKNNPLHNVLMGTVFLADYESRLGSRSHGILAYNMGVGGVKGTVSRMGKSMDNPPSVPEMAPHLKYTRRIKPRVYLWKVLASVIMMDKASRGEKLEKVTEDFTSDDIPGWDPMNDTWR